MKLALSMLKMEGLTLEVRFSECKGLINDNDYLMFADSEGTLSILIETRKVRIFTSNVLYCIEKLCICYFRRTYNIEPKKTQARKISYMQPIHSPSSCLDQVPSIRVSPIRQSLTTTPLKVPRTNVITPL